MNKILYVEDHDDTAKLVQTVAEQLGILLTVCADGASALKTLDESEFDAVILDLSMAVLDGLTIAEEIRNNEAGKHKKPVCIVFYTARTIDRAILSVANKVQVRAIYTKTADTDIYEMLQEIQDMCGDHQMIIKTQEKGISRPNAVLCLFAIIAQIVVGFLFLWLLNKQDVSAAYQFTRMKSDRDQLKSICDSNALMSAQKETFIQQNKLLLPPELSGQKPCTTASEDK